MALDRNQRPALVNMGMKIKRRGISRLGERQSKTQAYKQVHEETRK
jgi:hypothetical protein